MPSFDHVVTQWMSPAYVDGGSACISSHVHVVGCSTWPSTVKVHVAGSIFGVASAESTGHCLPVSYCPGGSRGSRSALPRPVKPRVNLAIPDSVARHVGGAWVVSGARCDRGGNEPTVMDVMDASVYVGDGVLEVQQVAVPGTGPARRAGRGRSVRDLRDRRAPGAREDRPTRDRARSRVGGDDRRARRRGRGLELGDRVVCGPSPGCGKCRACRAGRPSVCLDRPLTDHLDFRGAYARYVVAPAAQLLRDSRGAVDP